jgi:hypothetical protein
MFIQIGLSEIAALLGVAVALLTGDLWICVVGSVFGLIGLALTARGAGALGGRRGLGRRQAWIKTAEPSAKPTLAATRLPAALRKTGSTSRTSPRERRDPGSR